MEPETVTDDRWTADVLQSDHMVVVAFLHPSSTPCHAFGPVLDALSAALPEGARLLRLDTEANPMVAQTYDVSSLPTLLIFRGGVLRGRVVGARTVQRIWLELAPHLGHAPAGAA